MPLAELYIQHSRSGFYSSELNIFMTDQEVVSVVVEKLKKDIPVTRIKRIMRNEGLEDMEIDRIIALAKKEIGAESNKTSSGVTGVAFKLGEFHSRAKAVGISFFGIVLIALGLWTAVTLDELGYLAFVVFGLLMQIGAWVWWNKANRLSQGKLI